MLNNNMPSSSADGDGVRAAQAGAESRPKMVLTIDDDPDMPVIVISGLQGIHLAIRNAVASLQKPFNPEELLAIVDRVLSSDEEIRKAMDGE